MDSKPGLEAPHRLAVPEAVATAAPSSSPRHFRVSFELVLLGLAVAIAALLRFHALGQKNIWNDEGVSIALCRLDGYNFFRILWRHEANMTLYYLLLRAWLPFGNSEAYIRTLSVLPALATLPALYALGRRLFDAQVGLIASFLLALNAYHVRYSQEARSYSLYPLLCVLSSLYFLKCLEEPSRRNRIGHVLTSALAVYAHFFAGLLMVAQWLSLRFLDRKDLALQMKKNWRQFALAVSPLVLFVATTGVGVLRWVPRPRLWDLRVSALFLTGNGGNYLALAYLAACLAALTPIFRTALLPRVPWATWRYRFVLLWLLFPVLLVFVISQLKPFFLTRYFIFTLPALALLAAAGLARLPSRWLLAAALGLLAVLSLQGVSSYYQKDFDIPREDWRSATRFLLSHAQPGDTVLFHQPIGRMPYEYYRSVIPARASPTVIYPEHGDQLTYRDFYAGRAPDSFLESVPSRYRRVWVVLVYNKIDSAPDPTTRFLTGWFGRQYTTMQSWKFAGIELRLYRGAIPPASRTVE